MLAVLAEQGVVRQSSDVRLGSSVLRDWSARFDACSMNDYCC